jgi:HSP20 family protein
MAIVKWDPWSTLPTLQDRINKIFEESFPTRAGSDDEKTSLCDWRPVVDTYEEDDTIIINAELPGVDRDDVSIDVKDNILTIKGERAYDHKVKEEDYFRRERCFGKFHRAFTLPNTVDPNKIEASYKDGILKIKIPKSLEKQTRKIEIK